MQPQAPPRLATPPILSFPILSFPFLRSEAHLSPLPPTTLQTAWVAVAASVLLGDVCAWQSDFMAWGRTPVDRLLGSLQALMLAAGRRSVDESKVLASEERVTLLGTATGESVRALLERSRSENWREVEAAWKTGQAERLLEFARGDSAWADKRLVYLRLAAAHAFCSLRGLRALVDGLLEGTLPVEVLNSRGASEGSALRAGGQRRTVILLLLLEAFYRCHRTSLRKLPTVERLFQGEIEALLPYYWVLDRWFFSSV